MLLATAAAVAALTLSAPQPTTLITAYAASLQESEVLLSGTFEGREGKRGQGTARIVREGERMFLEFEGFRTSRGPQLEVWITDRTVRRNEDVKGSGYVDLGDLESHRRGTQRYELPEGFDLSSAASVTIWCEPFEILFASADLS
ncbi:DM13 domain-containing protein [Parvularcula maris]|uniref:DM13 domain-containing protein n=1 Tax=Parvularcula maris TaxID=2965077 RepID=A0A9X2LAX7_9PROT|nr:DM13 domain-containing protein [Parvularcula maris]MCQ8186366.1 DM13 domain-containing protein [Parvularcula maris]